MESESSAENKQKVILHLDVDAFYVAAERELRPELLHRPVAVSQYNPYGDLRDCSIQAPERILYDGREPQTKRHPNANGSLIAVSYEARAQNVKRNDRGLEAVRKCPELAIIQVPVLHGKANLSIYRSASERLMTALHSFISQSCNDLYQEMNTDASSSSYRASSKSIPLEKASVDEVYLDISTPVEKIFELCTKNKCWGKLYETLTREHGASAHTTIGGLETRQAAIATNSLSKDDIRRGSSLQVLDSEGYAEDQAGKVWWGRQFPDAWSHVEISLAIGACITLKARQSIVKKFDGIFTLSAGVSANKTMAKLASGLKKPNRQTLVNPNDETTLQKLFHPLPLGRIRGLGGKLGEKIEEVLQIKTVGDLKKVPLSQLKDAFEEKQANFLYRTAQGLCDEEVTERSKPKNIGAGKTFQGVLAIPSSDQAKLRQWIGNLVADIIDRMEGDKTRQAKNLVCWLNMSPPGGDKKDRQSASKNAPLPRNANAEKCTSIAMKLANGILQAAGSKNNINKEGILLVVGMSVTATNFVDIAQGSNSILDAFQRCSSTQSEVSRSPRAIGGLAKTKASEHRQETGHRLGTRSNTSRVTNPYSKQTPLAEIKSGNTCATTSQAFVVAKGNHLASKVKLPGPPKDKAGLEAVLSQSVHKIVQKVCQPAENVVEEANALEQKDEDPDLEYAKQLQASFDRENEVISNMEKIKKQSRSSWSSSRAKSQGKRRKLGAVSKPISTFFGKKN